MLNRPFIGSGPGTGNATPAGPMWAPSGNLALSASAALATLSQMPKPTPEAIAGAAARLQAAGLRNLSGSLASSAAGLGKPSPTAFSGTAPKDSAGSDNMLGSLDHGAPPLPRTASGLSSASMDLLRGLAAASGSSPGMASNSSDVQSLALSKGGTPKRPELMASSSLTEVLPPPPPVGCTPFYWVPTVDTITEFEVSGAAGEVVTKTGDYEDQRSALPIAGTLRMSKGGLYLWTLQIVRQCPRRPNLQFGVHGAGHARPWRLVSTGRCSRSRDDGPWLQRPGGDMLIGEGDYVHCEADLRGLDGPLGSFAYAVNDGPFETVFEDIPLSEGSLQPVVAMGGGGTTCRLCAT